MPSTLQHTYRLAASARPQSAIAVAQSRRGFSVLAARASKESDLNTSDAEQSERHKQDLLKKQKEGKGHWKPELASDSEEAVAADRHTFNGQKETLEELQKRTVEHADKKHRHGTSQDPGM